MQMFCIRNRFVVIASSGANRIHESTDREYRPWKQPQQQHRRVVPPRILMPIQIRTEARKILPQDELAKELRVSQLHQNKPRQRDRTENQYSRRPKRAQKEPPFAANQSEYNNNDC